MKEYIEYNNPTQRSSNPVFSVLIANYNNGQYLEECLHSIFAQTYQNWEIIIVDDGSTDKSMEVYKNYLYDPRVKVFYNSKNIGCGYSKQRCIELANGEMLGFIDADDVLLPHALDTMISAHNNNGDVSLVFSRHYICDSALNIKNESRLLSIPINHSYLTYMDYRPEVFASFKKSHILKTFGIDKDLPLAVDQDLYFKLEEVGKIMIIDNFTYKYRIHGANKSYVKEVLAFYWNMIVRHNACIRRKINPEQVSFLSFKKRLEYENVNGLNARLTLSFVVKKVKRSIKSMFIRLLFH